MAHMAKARADPSKAKDDGTTPVHAAAEGGHHIALQLLLNAREPD